MLLLLLKAPTSTVWTAAASILHRLPLSPSLDLMKSSTILKLLKEIIQMDKDKNLLDFLLILIMLHLLPLHIAKQLMVLQVKGSRLRFQTWTSEFCSPRSSQCSAPSPQRSTKTT